MDIYMDFDHFSSFMRNMSNEHFRMCNEMIKSNCDIYFTFSKDELIHAKKNVYRNYALWAKGLSTNRRGHVTRYDSDCPHFTNISSFESDKKFAALTSIYFVSGEDEHLLKDSIGNEVDQLRQFAIDDENIPTQLYSTRNMTDWEFIRKNSLPCSDIIIADLYLFSQSDTLYERNAYQLVYDLCSKVKNRQVNIVFFTKGKVNVIDSERLGINGRPIERSEDIPYNMITRNLKDNLKKRYNIEANITFVVLRKEEHDRTIFTNFKLFISGDSYKFFNNIIEGVVNNGRWVTVNTLIHNNIYRLSKEFIDDMQIIVDGLKSSLAGIRGDKISNFLNFDKPVQLVCTDND